MGNLKWTPPEFDEKVALLAPLSDEIESIIEAARIPLATESSDLLDPGSLVSRAIFEYKLEPIWDPPKQHQVRKELEKIAKRVGEIQEISKSYSVLTEILEAVADFNKTKSYSDKLDQTLMYYALEQYEQALVGHIENLKSPDRETPQMRLISKLCTAYEVLFGVPVSLIWDEIAEQVCDGPSLRFLNRAMDVTGHKMTDVAIRDAVSRIK